MRKLLLATVAVVSGSVVAGAVNAQTTPAPVPTTVPTPNPFTAAPSPTPGPGTITVRLNARVNFYAAAVSDSGRTGKPVTPTSASVPTLSTSTPATVATNASLGSPQTNTKLAPYQFFEYGRFYPGFDGIAGNGLKYGAAMEIRQDNGVAPGGGVNGSISANRRSRGALYFNVTYGYVGTDTLGFLRFGSTYGPSTLFITGTFENFNDGGWNGDLPTPFTGNSAPGWPFLDVGAIYTTDKLVYVSPQFYGFDFSASFAPNSGNVGNTAGNCPYGVTAASPSGIIGPVFGGAAGLGCDAASSTSSGDYTRPRNILEFGARYRGSFGPIGVALEGVGIVSGKVTDSATPQRAVQYDGYGIYDGGLQVTYGGLAVGGHITGGAVNGGVSLRAKGQKDEFAWLVGTSYAFGPLIVGASYWDAQDAGSRNVTSSAFVGTRNQYGIAAGGAYNFAPGMNIFLSYLYGHKREAGVDLLSGATSSATTRVTTNNNTQAQGISIGTQFRW